MRRIQLKSFTKNCATLRKSTIDLEWQEEWYISIFNQYVKTGTSWDLQTLSNALCHKGCLFWGGWFSRKNESLNFRFYKCYDICFHNFCEKYSRMGKNVSKVWKNILQIFHLIFWMLQRAEYLIYDYFYFLILLFLPEWHSSVCSYGIVQW